MNSQERGEFLEGLICLASPLQLAVQITSLPDRRFDEVISVLSCRPGLMASVMSWMTPSGRQRSAAGMTLPALSEAYGWLTEADRKRMVCPILLDWVKAAQKASDEKWKYGVGYVPPLEEWAAETSSARTGLALRMSDAQLDQLQESLK